MGSFRVLISSILYFIGTFLLNPACLLLLPFGSPTAGIMILICACSYLTAAASLDLVFVLHYQKRESNKLQKVNAICMWVGGVLFLTASVLYLPAMNSTLLDFSPTTLGTWVFRVGSCFYLGGSFISLHLLNSAKLQRPEDSKYTSLASSADTSIAPLLKPTEHNFGDSIPSTRRRGPRLSTRSVWLLVIYNYIFGAVAYIAGGVLSQFVGAYVVGGVAWCIGSLLFMVGAFLQLFEVVRSWNE